MRNTRRPGAIVPAAPSAVFQSLLAAATRMIPVLLVATPLTA
jgi:hypothetical protein